MEVMGSEPWKGRQNIKEDADCAAAYVSWYDALAYCKALTAREGTHYRLPTEEEWEYACRAGTQTAWNFGGEGAALGKYAWYAKNANDLGAKHPHQVRLKIPNPFGLYDMHGNVLEWCQDYYAKRDPQVSPEKDPSRPPVGASKVLKGGTWFNRSYDTRSARRHHLPPDQRNHFSGFRLVFQLESVLGQPQLTNSLPRRPD